MNAKPPKNLVRHFLLTCVFVCLTCPSPPFGYDADDSLTSPERLGPTGPVGVLEGQVQNASGWPVAGARVTLLGDLDNDERQFMDWWLNDSPCVYGFGEAMASEAAAVASTVTDVNGMYSLSGLPDGAYLLRVTAPGFGFAEGQVTILGAGDALVSPRR